MSKKEKIANFVKVFLLLTMMTLGFFFVYALVWFAVVSPLTRWPLVLCLALAGLSEYGFYRWCLEG